VRSSRVGSRAAKGSRTASAAPPRSTRARAPRPASSEPASFAAPTTTGPKMPAVTPMVLMRATQQPERADSERQHGGLGGKQRRRAQAGRPQQHPDHDPAPAVAAAVGAAPDHDQSGGPKRHRDGRQRTQLDSLDAPMRSRMSANQKIAP
jgi:hypothetical protein